jgi:hypothetical protein
MSEYLHRLSMRCLCEVHDVLPYLTCPLSGVLAPQPCQSTVVCCHTQQAGAALAPVSGGTAPALCAGNAHTIDFVYFDVAFRCTVIDDFGVIIIH